MIRRNRKKKIRAMLLTLSLALFMLSGCGGPANNGSTDPAADAKNYGQSGEDTGKASDDGASDSAPSPEQNEESTAMGRYVETVTDMSDYCTRVSGVTRLKDGTLIIADCDGTKMTLAEGGTEWEPDKIEWYRELNSRYVIDISYGEDGTAGIIYKPENEEESEEEQSYYADAQCLVIRPDGTQVPVKAPGPGDGWEPESVDITDTGRTFITSLDGIIYEVAQDGSAEKFLTVDRRPEQIQFCANVMIMDAERYDGLLLYDMEKKEYIEDEVLHDFVQENYEDRSYSTSDCYEFVFFAGEEGVIYIAGEKGLHRHVIGGNAMEQVIDGSLSCLGNPSYSYSLVEMTTLPDERFLAVFYGGKAVEFSYNPDIPTVPNERLKVYSLRENDTLRQGVSLYQISHPEVYVDYETGIGENDSVTRDDALKKLNTQIVAGQGPDVIILDDMPLDSYIEKNLLLDLSECLEGLPLEDALFENIVDAFRQDGKVYSVPCEIQLPLMAGKEKYISMAKDLEGIADMMEQLRKDNPEKPLLRICSEKGIMRYFAVTSFPALKAASGELDEEAVKEFLKQTKRIYDAQMDGLPAQYVEDYMNNNVSYSAYFKGSREDSEYFRNADSMGYLAEESQAVFGATSYHSAICEVFSIKKVEGFENDMVLPMAGMSKNVFIPKTLIGINAASGNIEGAKEMVRLLLGKESQSNLYYGFSVNKEAFPEMYNINESWVSEEGVFASMGSSSPDGKSIGMEIYILSDEQKKQVQGWMETISTPYIMDTVLENAIYSAGIEYIRGMISLDEAVSAISQRAYLYMSE